METEERTQWVEEWLTSVADGSNTMSQRKISSVEERGGGLDAVKVIAQQKGVHLLLIEDDKGNELVAASTKPFTVLCEARPSSPLRKKREAKTLCLRFSFQVRNQGII